MRLLLFILFLVLSGVTGCGDTASNSSLPPVVTNNKNEITKPKEIAGKIATWDETLELVKSHKGKVVVVDVWSTWCPPCVREYPHLVALQKKYPQQVACISFNLDHDGTEETVPKTNYKKLLAFYQKQHSEIENIVSSTLADDFYDATDVASLPVVYVYNSDGTLNKRFEHDKKYGDEGFTYKQHITPLVEQLLKK